MHWMTGQKLRSVWEKRFGEESKNGDCFHLMKIESILHSLDYGEVNIESFLERHISCERNTGGFSSFLDSWICCAFHLLSAKCCSINLGIWASFSGSASGLCSENSRRHEQESLGGYTTVLQCLCSARSYGKRSN